MKKIFFLLLVLLCLTSCKQTLPDGWYHVDNTLSDSIVTPSILTVRDIVDIRLDSTFTQYGKVYAISCRVSNEKRDVWADATEKAIGQTIVYISDGKVINAPRVNMRIDGGRFQITTSDSIGIKNVYQRILLNYSPGEADDMPKYSIYTDPMANEPVSPGSDITIREVMRFDSLLNAWQNDYRTDPVIMVSSNTNDARKLEQYPYLLDMGKKMLPLLVPQLVNENNFFMLTLYDDLQDNQNLIVLPRKGSEQSRARETVKKYVEDRLGIKKRVFHSDAEKLEALKTLLEKERNDFIKSHGNVGDSIHHPFFSDSVLMNLDYEITEALMNERWL